MPNKVHVKKGDTVVVISGKYKGKQGKVLTVLPKDKKVVVEGVNIVKKHVRPNPKMPQGGIITQEAPIWACKVMLVCPKCGKPTRIGHRFIQEGEEERKVRTCKKCGEIID
ncbi:ribosomal protein L24 [Caldicellulosiruptor acetigenus I77R1B]|uniref:Large ribosomal subunit protein uL24 n=4 Tax=Caldicellulosiruptor TaxID=44000 RepID=E4Q826_CALH1|nr:MULTISPECIES: 50S ribosomal protein L24 [Caldicellulosiruptor]ADL42159.1 ribosomal protein L24 [Caldicellulosiruptor obsidiansis OB47]ADQ06742.1 ribosomal protein L24 [Caldicellulosiruptor hydrothermalis 108]ADQ41238.1 ribosomal protein L24 [Caldicellulosiruptor acetigenus I77R1B]WAM37169.1 50S ribosomal protein L24 [Caldicellulosiruptor acetigenus]BCS80846.1 50S ribosomal protein L24 [Caldicellulosiruptor diazotrophicus]